MTDWQHRVRATPAHRCPECDADPNTDCVGEPWARLAALTDAAEPVVRRLENSGWLWREASRSFIEDVQALRSVLDSVPETP